MAETWLEDTDVPAAQRVPVLPAHYAELRSRLVGAVRRVCPPWLAADAEDLVQDALIRLVQRNDRLGGNLSVTSAYLKKVAYCAVVDEMRRRQRLADFGAAGSEIEQEDLVDPAAPAHEDAAVGRAITDCLQAQSSDRRRALTLHLLGHSVPETARILGCNAKRAENLVYRGLAQLRDCLIRKGYER